MKCFCIADEDTVRGFRLAGVAGQVAGSASAALSALEIAVAQPEYDVILLTEAVAGDIRPEVERIRHECNRPLIVEIPGPGGPSPGRKSLQQLVQESVGIHVNLEKGN